MNLQQLNGSGRSLADFVLTALLALIITGGAWYVIEVLNEYRKWQEDRNQQWSRKEPSFNHSVAERIGMIVWLLRSGHWSWMRETGAWWRIFFNNGRPLKRYSGALTEYSGYPEMMLLGDLVSRCSADPVNNNWLRRYHPENWEAF